MIYTGDTINIIKSITSWDDCNSECVKNEKCKYWSWFAAATGSSSEHDCKLKTSDNGRQSKTGVVSGSRGCKGNNVFNLYQKYREKC